MPGESHHGVPTRRPAPQRTPVEPGTVEGPAGPLGILGLQRNAGNAAVSHLLGGMVQRERLYDDEEAAREGQPPIGETAPQPETRVHPTVRYGSQGAAVEECQTKLNLSPAVTELLEVDGIFGSRTLAAVREFQTAQGLDVDGIVGPITWGELDRLTETPEPEEPGGGGGELPPPPDERPWLRQGDGPSEIVGRLQQKLNAAGSPHVAVTGLFGPETTASVRAFQTANGMEPTGETDPMTWLLLDAFTTEVTESGQTSVLTPEGAHPRGTPTDETGATTSNVHPTIRRGDTGPAVEECQQRLNNDPGILDKPTVNGSFDEATERAVSRFQRDNGLLDLGTIEEGVVGPGTWAFLDMVPGPVTVGREEFTWKERVEGTEYGGPSRFTWRLLPDRMLVRVSINFTQNPGHPRVAQWCTDITDVWNRFSFEDPDTSGSHIPLVFEVARTAPFDATVAVIDDSDRSHAGDWHTGDTRKSLAPHEFGHLIGLEDEYNRPEEQFVSVVGYEATTGRVTPTSATPPATIATQLRNAVTQDDEARRAPDAAAVVTTHALVPGGFAQQVAQAYRAAFAPDFLREDLNPRTGTRSVVADPHADVATDIAARCPGVTRDESTAAHPFGYSTETVMGTGQAIDDPGAADHEHPVAARHVAHFLEIFRTNRPGNWELREGT